MGLNREFNNLQTEWELASFLAAFDKLYLFCNFSIALKVLFVNRLRVIYSIISVGFIADWSWLWANSVALS